MTNIIKVDTRFLEARAAQKFNVSKRAAFEEAYQKALDSIMDTKGLPYVPTAYIFPYILVKDVKVGDEILRGTYFNLTSVDPDDLTKLAMFPSIFFVKRVPPKYLASSIAHELAHVMDVKGDVNGFLKYVNRRFQEGFVAMRKSMEYGAETTYNRFKEPVRSWLFEWDDRVNRRKDYENVTKGAQFMDYGKFLEYILGDKFKNFMEATVSKIKEKLKLKNTPMHQHSPAGT